MARARWVFMGLALALMAGPAQAQYVSPQNVVFKGVSPWGFSQTGYGVYIGPYGLQLMGEPGQPTVDAFCVDFENYAYTGSSGWTANINNLGSGTMSQTRQWATYGNATVVQARYQAAAYLVSKMNPGNAADWWKYHGAAWYVMSGPTFTSTDKFYSPFMTKLTATQRAQVLALVNEALNTGYTTVNAADWAVITPSGVPNSQEFITNVVPEPETILLLASGLLALGLVAYVRSAA